MSIGDVNSNEKGSGARYNDGKADFSLIPMCTLEDEAKVWAYGKKKYAAWNWCKGMDWDVPFACMMRHMAAWQRGEENDPESGLPHLAHAMCNLRMLTLFSKTYKEGDHRPTKWLEEWVQPMMDKEKTRDDAIEAKKTQPVTGPIIAGFPGFPPGSVPIPNNSIPFYAQGHSAYRRNSLLLTDEEKETIEARRAGLLPKDPLPTNDLEPSMRFFRD